MGNTGMEKLSELQFEIERQILLKDPYAFSKKFWNTFNGTKLEEHWLLEYYCECFAYSIRNFLPDYIKSDWMPDDKYNKLVDSLPEKYPRYKVFHIRNGKRWLSLNVGPRHSKSSYMNVILSVWGNTICPFQVASVSHVSGLSTTMNTDRQRILNSDLYKYYFPEIELVENTKSKLFLNTNGELYSVAAGSMTGFGGDVIILDDLINAQDADKQQESFNTAMKFLEHTLLSRLNNPETTGVIINIQQRLAKNDPTGWFMEHLADYFNFVSLPAEYKNESVIYVFPCSGKIVIKEKGSFLWPERFGDYSKYKRAEGESNYNAQYLQNPGDVGTYVSKKDILLISEEEAQPIIADPEFVMASYDLAMKDAETNAFTGITMMYYKDSTLIITDCIEEHMTFDEVEQFIKNTYKRIPSILQVIEDKAAGEIIVPRLQGKIPGIIPFDPGKNSKSQRLAMANLWLISKNVKFLAKRNVATGQLFVSDRLQNLIDRLVAYPNVQFIDIIDSTTQGILYTFKARQFAIFWSNVSSENTFNYDPIIKTDIPQLQVGAVIKEGNSYKMLKGIYERRLDKILVTNENVYFGADFDAIDAMTTFFKDCRNVIDATPGAYIYNIAMRQMRMLMPSSDKRTMTNRHMQLSYGLAQKKVLWHEHCVEVKRDVLTASYDTKSLEVNSERLVMPEGYVKCITDLIYYFKGATDFSLHK